MSTQYSVTADPEGNAIAVFGSTTITFYPLSLKLVQQSLHLLKELRKPGGDDDIESRWPKIIELLTMSAQRGDPAVTKEDVEKVVDLRTWKPLLDIVMGNSGLVADGGAAARPLGNGALPTGGASTPASSQPQAGAGKSSTH